MYCEEVVGVLKMINKTLMEVDEEIRSLSMLSRPSPVTPGSDGRTTTTVPQVSNYIFLLSSLEA
jgi:hypothetical protein